MTYISRKYQFKKFYFLNWYFAALRSALSEITIAGGAIYRYMKRAEGKAGRSPNIVPKFQSSRVPWFQGLS